MAKDKANLYLICLLVVLFAASGFYLHGHPQGLTANGPTGPAPCRVEGLHVAAPVPVSSSSRGQPYNQYPVLTWQLLPEAVAYELELYADKPASTAQPFFTTKRIYIHGYIPALPADFSGSSFWWRVRALDYYSQPLSDFCAPQQVWVQPQTGALLRPVPMTQFNSGKGTVLLYPVYLWIPVPGATKYEVEILDAPPENPDGVEPSAHRVDAFTDTGFDAYDPHPRYGSKPFYWRVRGVTDSGKPVGVYSAAQKFITDPAANYQVATLGDSICHGGGSFSYAPSEWEFSFQHYLNFPTLNLGRSGDTAAMTLARFDADVLPFHPRYLLIMTGSNSLRSVSHSAEAVIEQFKTLEQKCLANGITPVFITLPPINPANIKKAFDEDTDKMWQIKFAKVNDYLRTRRHIDAAARFKNPNSTLPTAMALDGLHVDVPGKKLIAAAVNDEFKP